MAGVHRGDIGHSVKAWQRRGVNGAVGVVVIISHNTHLLVVKGKGLGATKGRLPTYRQSIITIKRACAESANRNDVYIQKKRTQQKAEFLSSSDA